MVIASFSIRENMGQTRKLKATLTEHEDGVHVLSWPDSSSHTFEIFTRIVTKQEILADFPEFCSAIRECHADLNLAVDLDQFISCASYSYAEDVMKRKRFQVTISRIKVLA